MKMSTYLVAFVVGPFEETAPVDGARGPAPRRPPHRQGPPGSLRPGGRPCGRCASSPTTSPSPTPATRSTSSRSPTSPSAPWRTSGCVTFREVDLLDRPGDRVARGAPPRGQGRRPRARPHVVRRPRDDGVVGGHLAQRGVRHVHGGRLRRPVPPRVAALGPFRPSTASWPSRIDACTPPVRSSSRSSPPSESLAMVDFLTYEKGASVLRMLEQYLGRRGLPRRHPRLPQATTPTPTP